LINTGLQTGARAGTWSKAV